MRKRIVITGSSRGIGFGLAERFVEAGCGVMLNGRSEQAVADAAGRLERYGGLVATCPADVSSKTGVEVLYDAAVDALGGVDIWINNAGITQTQLPAWQLDGEEFEQVVNLNILGVVYGTVIPYARMRRQGYGMIYNMDGLGSDGFMMEGMTLYGMSKSAVSYFTRSFAREVRGESIGVGSMSPGMVVTDMLRQTVSGDDPEALRRKKFFNVMADNVEDVTAFLCRKALAIESGSPRITWLTKPRMLGKLLRAPFVRRDFFSF